MRLLLKILAGNEYSVIITHYKSAKNNNVVLNCNDPLSL